MATVYLSSTKVDLDAEREQIIRLLVDAKHDVRHSYRASPDPLVQTCLSDVRECDVYLVLCGRRYGHRPPHDNPQNLSITELEFQAAQEAGKEIIALEQARPPIELSDYEQGRLDDEASRKLFLERIRQAVVPGRWTTPETLAPAVLNGINEAVKRLDAKRREHAPPITPGASRPHPRLLARSLLLLHLGGDDEALAGRLAETLSGKAVGWSVERCRWNPEDGLDWPGFDGRLSACRAAAVLITGSAPRIGPDGAPLARLLAFAQQQCGFVAGLVVGTSEAALPWLAGLPLQQRHALDGWAAGASHGPGAITPDLAQAVKQMRLMHPDIEDPKLVGLPCMVVAMTRAEAQALQAEPSLLATLGDEQRRYFTDAVQRLQAGAVPWLDRYGATREDWQPFGPLGQTPRPALAVLREVAGEINRQPVMPRRDQQALVGHRIRLRPYPFEPLVAEDADWLALMEQVKPRRVLALVDELSLCHPAVRAAATDLLSDPQAVVATIAPFDPPAQPVEAALKGNSVFRLGNLVNRFMVAMDPQCELNLTSNARLKRWLRLSIPEALAGQAGTALEDRRSLIRSETGVL